MFVWVFHRISGVLLIFLLALQLFSGFFQASTSNSETVKALAGLHNQAVLNSLLVFLIIFHALYGVRTILMDLGVQKERMLFWVCTILGAVLFGGFLAAFAMVVA